MPFVIDASVAGAWMLPDEQNTSACKALERLKDEDAYVPMLFWFEVRNLLLTSERRKRITSIETAKALEGLGTLPIKVDRLTDSDLTLQLAREHSLTVYDAAYLELTMRRGFELLTLDNQLLKAGKALGVTSK